MSNFTQSRNTFVQAVRPAAERAAGAANGLAIDKEDEIHDEAVFVFETGAVSGTPTSFSVTASLEHSDDDGDTDAYAQVTDLNIVAEDAATKVIDAINTIKTFAVRTAGLKRFYRVVLTVAFVGGTTPKVYTGAIGILGKRRYD